MTGRPPQPFGPRRADVVLAQNLQQLRTCHARNQGRSPKAQSQRRQHQAFQIPLPDHWETSAGAH